jgi:cytochrome c oxidase subunit 2
VAALFWWMAGGSLLIWMAVVALALYCAAPDRQKPGAQVLIVGGGVAVPVLVLAALLVYGLAMLPPLVARAPADALQVSVVGEQWWWRVRYLPDGGDAIELANELRLPVGERVQLRLDSDNVIHSFWVPSLGGKMDMIPGRTTYLALQPTRTGIFRGVCAEYCGTSHAQMAFYVEVMEREAFDRWLAQQGTAAAAPDDDLARLGAGLFLANGCAACHRIAGTAATGRIGPDLTHVASRHSIAAGVLPTTADALRRWLADTSRIKPGVHMPAFGMLPEAELQALAAYLTALE